MKDFKVANLLQVGAGTPQTLSSTGVHSYSFLCMTNCRLTRVLGYVTTALNSTGTTTVQVIKRTSYGSSTGQVVLATINFPTTAAVDTCYYKDITPVNLNLGDQIVFNVSTAATTGGAAIYDIEVDYTPEYQANQTKLVASA